MALGVIALVPAFPAPLEWLSMASITGKLLYGIAIACVTVLAIVLGRKEDRERDLAQTKLQETIDDVAGRLPVLPVSPGVENLFGLSNAQIRQRVATLVEGMRTFEAGTKRSFISAIHTGGMSPAHATPEQQHAAYEARNERVMQSSQAAQSEFGVRFRPEAVALREEMWRRLGILQPPVPVDHHTIALDHGMLAGPSPISDAAVHLEALARKLPA